MEQIKYSRNIRLSKINHQLNQLGLKSIKDIGDSRSGEIELLSINTVNQFALFTDITFDALFPNGRSGLYAIRFNAHSERGNGAIFVTRINRKYWAFVQQFRVPLGKIVTCGFWRSRSLIPSDGDQLFW